MTYMCACGQRPVDNLGQPVEKSENPARKILDAMPLILKPVTKPRTDSQPTGAHETTQHHETLIHNQDQIIAAILDVIDLIHARLDALENRIDAS